MLKWFTGIGWYGYAALGVLLAAAIAWGYVERTGKIEAQAKLATFQRDIETERALNAELVVKEQQRQISDQAQFRAANAASVVSCDTKVKTVVEGIKNAPDANTVAGPGFDALGDGLRKLETDR